MGVGVTKIMGSGWRAEVEDLSGSNELVVQVLCAWRL